MARHPLWTLFPLPSFSPQFGPGLAHWLQADAGLYKNAAAQFTSANSESLSVADNATLPEGDIDFWIAGWGYLDSVAGDKSVLSKFGAAGNRSFLLQNITTSGRLRFYITHDGTTLANATHGTDIVISTWYFFMAYHDAVSNTIGISLNGGAFATTAHTTGVFDSSAAFRLGGRDDASEYYGGRLDSVAFGKSPVGGLAALAATIRDRLYASGSGLYYSDLASAEKTAWGLASWWDLDEASGTRSDSHGTNNLTDNNTVTQAGGKPNKAASSDGDPIALWVDQNGALNASQTTLSKRSSLKLTPTRILSDGVDDTLSATGLSLTGDFTLYCVFRCTAADAGTLLDLAQAAAVGCQITMDGTGKLALAASGGPAGTSATAAGYADSTPHLITLTRSGTDYSLQVDGDTPVTCSGTAPTYTRLFLWNPASGSDYWAGSLQEMATYSTLHAAAVQAQWRAYAQKKWGTP